MASRWDDLQVDGSAMPAHITLPQAPAPVPGALVCMHAPGVDEFIRDICSRLEAAGFASIAPDVYHRQRKGGNPLERMARLSDEELLADMAAATEHLKAQPGVDGARSAVVGFCMGGRLAYLQASQDSSLAAAVVFYGGNIMAPWGGPPTPFERSAGIACPVLGLFGNEDQNPSPADVERLDAELTRLGKAHEFHRYDGAGHAFLNFLRPSFRPGPAADAWDKCIDWLTRYAGA